MWVVFGSYSGIYLLKCSGVLNIFLEGILCISRAFHLPVTIYWGHMQVAAQYVRKKMV